MLEYYAHIAQEDLLLLNRQGTILRVFIKWLKEMRRHSYEQIAKVCKACLLL